MSVVSLLKRRIVGTDIAELRSEIESVRTTVESVNHRVVVLEELLQNLNHDVRAGSGEVLPMFLGYAERFRTDADTMIGVTELVERQLAQITDQVERLTAVAERAAGAAPTTD